jgi:citrate synthase
MGKSGQRGFNNQPGDFLSAREAARFLGVKLATLYAYASRGLVRSTPAGTGGQRRYAAQDLERLKARHDARRGHAPVAAGALRWGEPVLASALTAIREDGPHYRGQSAASLAAGGVRFESVAEDGWRWAWACGCCSSPRCRCWARCFRASLPA